MITNKTDTVKNSIKNLTQFNNQSKLKSILLDIVQITEDNEGQTVDADNKTLSLNSDGEIKLGVDHSNNTDTITMNKERLWFLDKNSGINNRVCISGAGVEHTVGDGRGRGIIGSEQVQFGYAGDKNLSHMAIRYDGTVVYSKGSDHRSINIPYPDDSVTNLVVTVDGLKSNIKGSIETGYKERLDALENIQNITADNSTLSTDNNGVIQLGKKAKIGTYNVNNVEVEDLIVFGDMNMSNGAPDPDIDGVMFGVQNVNTSRAVRTLLKEGKNISTVAVEPKKISLSHIGESMNSDISIDGRINMNSEIIKLTSKFVDDNTDTIINSTGEILSLSSTKRNVSNSVVNSKDISITPERIEADLSVEGESYRGDIATVPYLLKLVKDLQDQIDVLKEQQP